ncbi:MAG: hypothetical protein KAX31_03000 [Thermoplasmata archaeon]|nr:hypothetical protein [Thermoplasmata archaeon]
MMAQRLSGDYSEGLTSASLSALVELAVTLKSYRDSIVLVGGWVPYFLIDEFGRGNFRHVGSIDIDLAVNPEEIDADAYASIVDMIERRGYKNRLDREGNPLMFSFNKPVPSPIDHKEYIISVDFLTMASPESGRHRHRTIQPGLPARIAGGCELAFSHNIDRELSGMLPGDGEAIESIKMLDIAGCIGMKGIVLGERYKEKDAYDIYSVIGYCLNSPTAVAENIRPHLEDQIMNDGIESIKQKFRDIHAEGPSWTANFLSLDPEVKKREQAAAFVTVQEFLEAL